MDTEPSQMYDLQIYELNCIHSSFIIYDCYCLNGFLSWPYYIVISLTFIDIGYFYGKICVCVCVEVYTHK